jgi:hypothetical protein
MEPWRDIKEWLLRWGGLYITNRQVGKTLALLEILHEDPRATVLTCNIDQAECMRKIYNKRFYSYSFSGGCGKSYREEPGIDQRIMASWKFSTISKSSIKNKNIYIDEYFFHDPKNLPKEFAGAVSSMQFPVKIKRFDRYKDIIGQTSAELRWKEILDDKQYRIEHSLDFTDPEEIENEFELAAKFFQRAWRSEAGGGSEGNFCEECYWGRKANAIYPYKRAMIVCNRFPETRRKEYGEYCGEFKLR